MSETLKFLKNDALVKIVVSSSFVSRLQQLLFYIIKDVSKEKLEEYKRLVEEKKESDDEILNHIITISALLKDIEDKADEQGLSFESDDPATQPES
jgi:hypothetical protein